LFRCLLTSIVTISTMLICSSALADKKVFFWVGNHMENRVQFEYNIIKEALSLTEQEFGKVELVILRGEESEKRVANEVNKGKIHLIVTTRSPQDIPAYRELLWIESPYISGLLSFRKLMTLKSKIPELHKVKDLAHLQDFRIGQVANWSDNKFYEQAGIKLVKAENTYTLFNMLSANRFDLLPLGTHEINDFYHKHKQQHFWW